METADKFGEDFIYYPRCECFRCKINIPVINTSNTIRNLAAKTKWHYVYLCNSCNDMWKKLSEQHSIGLWKSFLRPKDAKFHYELDKDGGYLKTVWDGEDE